MIANATNPTSVHRAIEGLDIAVYLVESLSQAGPAARDHRAATIVAPEQRLGGAAHRALGVWRAPACWNG